jgi:hypothetical protein
MSVYASENGAAFVFIILPSLILLLVFNQDSITTLSIKKTALL